MATWQEQDAKAHLAAVIARARAEGPQLVTRQGVETAVLLSIEDYRALVEQATAARPAPPPKRR